ncbi:hypothetical protein BCF74_101171 [Knoellia remsis]|uniref:Uncharacterized protein n=1 Tax=Knoellia remsis TaxID=407159 RepID=A0A2T0V0Q3_9MICO|nr:hypothetical protein [Knoellia remsis]PRY63769.1 hypothetical protein BCF74_101171 [Knoellia remsis]
MPSYRVAVDILGVLPGVRPEDVLPAAERIVASTHVVEDRSVEVAGATGVRPQPQVHLRFVVPSTGDGSEDDEAEAVVRALVDDLGEIARCGRWELRKGPGRRWRPLTSGTAAARP